MRETGISGSPTGRWATAIRVIDVGSNAAQLQVVEARAGATARRYLTGEQDARLTYPPWAFREGIMLERLSSLREEEPLML
jgi:exopolyphosphatase/pppGpp-phosphohydrolase